MAHVTLERVQDAPLVPLGALFRRGDAWAVYVIDAPGLARERRVEIGAADQPGGGAGPGGRRPGHPAPRRLVTNGTQVFTDARRKRRLSQQRIPKKAAGQLPGRHFDVVNRRGRLGRRLSDGETASDQVPPASGRDLDVVILEGARRGDHLGTWGSLPAIRSGIRSDPDMPRSASVPPLEGKQRRRSPTDRRS